MVNADVLAQFASTPLKIKKPETAKPSPWNPTGRFTPSKRPLDDATMSFATPSKQRRLGPPSSASKAATPSALREQGRYAPHSMAQSRPPPSAKKAAVTMKHSSTTSTHARPQGVASTAVVLGASCPQVSSSLTESAILPRDTLAPPTPSVPRSAMTPPRRTAISMPSPHNPAPPSRSEAPRLPASISRRPLAPVSPQQPSPASLANQLPQVDVVDKASKPLLSSQLHTKLDGNTVVIQGPSITARVPTSLRQRVTPTISQNLTGQPAVRASRRLVPRRDTTGTVATKPAVPKRFVQSKLTLAALPLGAGGPPAPLEGPTPSAASAALPTNQLPRRVLTRKPASTNKTTDVTPSQRRRTIATTARPSTLPAKQRLTTGHGGGQPLPPTATSRLTRSRGTTHPPVKSAGATFKPVNAPLPARSRSLRSLPAGQFTAPPATSTTQALATPGTSAHQPSTALFKSPHMPTKTSADVEGVASKGADARPNPALVQPDLKQTPSEPCQTYTADSRGVLPASEAATSTTAASHSAVSSPAPPAAQNVPSAAPLAVVSPEEPPSIPTDAESTAKLQEELVASETITGHVFAQCWAAGLDSTVYAWQSNLFSALVECERLCLHDASPSQHAKVAFQCYDLSVMELQYVSERGTTQRVESILHHCDRVARKLIKLAPSQVRHIQSVLDRVIITAASSPTQRAAAAYFRTVMDSSARVLLNHIARLSNSLGRHYLRVIFLYFDDRLTEDKTSTVALPDHYAHQDLGAAIHRALDDRFVYKTAQTTPKERYYYATSVEFLFQAIHLVLQTAKDAYLTSLIRKLQTLCLRLVQCNCDDEAHLYPLASLASFESTLQRELAAIDMKRVRREYVVPRSPLKSIPMPDQESTPLKERYRSSTACFECKEAWKDLATTVQCAACQKRYHLKCLYLSPTFRNLSGTYKCPHCL